MGNPKWLNNKKSVRKNSDDKVKKLAKKVGGKVVANSGATPFSKGDMKVGQLLIEHKYTDKKSFKLDNSELHKIYTDACKAGKDPVFMIQFTDGYTLVGKVLKTVNKEDLDTLN